MLKKIIFATLKLSTISIKLIYGAYQPNESKKDLENIQKQLAKLDRKLYRTNEDALLRYSDEKYWQSRKKIIIPFIDQEKVSPEHITDHYKNSLLWESVFRDDIPLALLLLNKKANPNHTYYGGKYQEVLSQAKSIGMANALIKHGADITRYGHQCIRTYATDSHVSHELVLWCTMQGVDANCRVKHDTTPLFLLIKSVCFAMRANMTFFMQDAERIDEAQHQTNPTIGLARIIMKIKHLMNAGAFIRNPNKQQDNIPFIIQKELKTYQELHFQLAATYLNNLQQIRKTLIEESKKNREKHESIIKKLSMTNYFARDICSMISDYCMVSEDYEKIESKELAPN
jgi:hypothetical protein